ncbi:MAG: hypothetical protein M0Q88_00730 [Bacilli bacterium]|nr:hypothetical protein [Bacilli bacterium]
MKKGLTLEEAFKALSGRGKVTESEKKLKEEFDDFPKLIDLAKGDVFTAYFGNHESCDFSYDSKKDTLIQKYYDPADTFKFKNIKTQTDFEKVVKDELGDGKITWEKKVRESAATEVKIPEPYNKYYQVAEVDGGYKVGDQIEGYDIRILAYLDAKPEYEDILKEPFAVLTDDEDYPVCVIVGRRLFNVSIRDLPEE